MRGPRCLHQSHQQLSWPHTVRSHRGRPAPASPCSVSRWKDDRLVEQVQAARADKLPIVMAHETRPQRGGCQFSHGDNELKPRARDRQYKTKPCKNLAKGHCPYGHRCRFIHGDEEKATTQEGGLRARRAQRGALGAQTPTEFLRVTDIDAYASAYLTISHEPLPRLHLAAERCIWRDAGRSSMRP